MFHGKFNRNNYLNLAGVNAFDPERHSWQGRFGVNSGFIYGLEQVAIPNTRFRNALMKRGTLRSLVLQSFYDVDMLQALSLVACSPMLREIEISAGEIKVLRRIDSIRQSCRHNKYPLEVTFSHHPKRILAKLVIGGRDNSLASARLVTARPNIPSMDILG